MKISHLIIENFKSFSKGEIHDLKKINMIFGLNNCGKSNFLKLIELLFRAKKNVEGEITAEIDDTIESHETMSRSKFWEGIIENEPFIFKKNETNNPIQIACSVILDEIEVIKIGSHYNELMKEFPVKVDKQFTVEFVCKIFALDNFNSKIMLESVKINDKIAFNSNGHFKNVKSTSSLYENQEAVENLMKLMNNSVLLIDNDRYFKNEKEDKSVEVLNSKNLKNWMFNLSLDEFNRNTFADLISSMKEFRISGDKEYSDNEKSNPLKDLKILFARLNDHIEMVVDNEFIRQPLSNFGTGIQQIFYLLLKMFEANAKIVLIEEIELNLSPKYQIELMQFLNNQVVEKKRFDQIFFTTHSPLLCYRGDFNIIKASINGKGETQLKDVDREEIEKFSKIREFISS